MIGAVQPITEPFISNRGSESVSASRAAGPNDPPTHQPTHPRAGLPGRTADDRARRAAAVVWADGRPVGGQGVTAYRQLAQRVSHLYDDAVDLKASDFTTLRRLIAGLGGLIAFLVFLYLAFKAWPRPFLARGDVTLEANERGVTVIQPRAIERVAELAARGNPEVTAASGRLGDEQLSVGIDSRQASSVAATLRDVQERVRAELERHDLPNLPVNVTLTGYQRKTKRELA